MLHEGKRTYSYMLSSVESGTTASGFPFHDSNGDRMNCNFAQVTVHYTNKNDAGAVAIVYAEPSGSGHTSKSMVDNITIAEEYNTTEAVAGNVSGTCGAVLLAGVNCPRDTHIFKADNGALIDSVNLHVHEDYSTKGTINIIITYGNVTPFNIIRQNRYDKGI